MTDKIAHIITVLLLLVAGAVWGYRVGTERAVTTMDYNCDIRVGHALEIKCDECPYRMEEPS